MSENARKEFSIERLISKFDESWKHFDFRIEVDRRNLKKLGFSSKLTEQVEDQLSQISTIKGTRHAQVFHEEILFWEKSISQIGEIIENLFNVQRLFLSVEGIFSSEQILRQIPTETKIFRSANEIWQKEILQNIEQQPNVFLVATTLGSFVFSSKVSILMKEKRSC